MLLHRLYLFPTSGVSLSAQATRAQERNLSPGRMPPCRRFRASGSGFRLELRGRCFSTPTPMRRLLRETFDNKRGLSRRIPDPLAIVELDVIEAVSVDVFEHQLGKSAPRVAVSRRPSSIIIVWIPKAWSRGRSAESGDRRRHRLRRPLDALQGIRVRIGLIEGHHCTVRSEPLDQ